MIPRRCESKNLYHNSTKGPMKKTLIILTIIALFLWVLFYMFWSKWEKVPLSSQLQKLSQPESISHGSGEQSMVVYLDYTDNPSRAFMRLYAPLFLTLINDNMVTLQFRYASETNRRQSQAFYCAFAEGKHMEFTSLFLQDRTPPESMGDTTYWEYAKKLNISSKSFQKCLDWSIYGASISRDISEYKWLTLKNPPILLLNGEEIPLIGQTPLLLAKRIYTSGIDPAVRSVTPPITWWQREDGWTGELDASIATPSRKWNLRN